MENETAESVRSHFSLLSPRLADLPSLLLFLILPVLICGAVLAGKVPVASNTLALWAPWSQLPHQPIANSAIADSALLYLPWNNFERESIASGEWPLWNPYNFSGSSFAANSQSQLYYPLTWLWWLLPLSGAIQALAVVNLWFAAVGMYALCRHFGVSRPAACLAGLGFGGSGMLQLAIELPGVATPYGWLPWMLLAVDNAITARTPRWIALATLVCGLQLVAGNLQWCIYSYFALAVWIAWRGAGIAVGMRPVARNTAAALLAGAIPLLGGIAIAAVHLAPVLELTGLSTRADSRISSHSAPLYDLLRLLMPEYFGTSVGNVGSPLVFNDLWYAGIGLLALALLALLLPGPRERWLWAGVALFAVFVAYGVGPFLYVRWLPGVSGLLPSRIGYLFIFAVCLLGALGLDAWFKRSAAAPRAALWALLVVATLLSAAIVAAQWLATASANQDLASIRAEQVLRALVLAASSLALLGALPILSLVRNYQIIQRAGTKSVRGAVLSLGLIVMLVDIGTVAPDYNSFVEPSDVIPRSQAIDWLKAQTGPARVLGLGAGSAVPALVPNTDMLFGLQSVAGYDSLHTARYENFWATVDPAVKVGGSSTPYSNVFVRPQQYSSTLASLLNVRYIASASALAETSDLRVVYTGEITIYESRNVMPRAFVVGTAEVLPQVRVLGRLGAPDFDPTSVVLLEAESAPPDISPSGTPGERSGTAQIASYKRNSVQVNVTMSRPGWLVLADQNYPGWSATVDGKSRPVYYADYVLRAVQVGPGDHVVTFTFVPTNFWPALGITLAAVALALGTLAGNGVPFRRRIERAATDHDKLGQVRSQRGS